MHYARWKRNGDPLVEPNPRVTGIAQCTVEGCERKPKSRGHCNMHAVRLQNHGTTGEPFERRFWSRVEKAGPDDCWEWTGTRQLNGYGNFGSGATRSRLVHRIAYELLVGPIPAGLVLDHTCHTRMPECQDNADCPHRRCVNPAHLEPVTYRENIRRGNQGAFWGYVPQPRKPKLRAVVPLLCTECGKQSPYKRGICRPCYRRWLKDPSVERPSQRTPEQRFWSKVQKTATCWLWTASINATTGYGRFGPKHGQGVDAHRYSYELAHGAIPEGHDVHHVCHVRHCVNPEHLQAVTRSENLRLRKIRRT